VTVVGTSHPQEKHPELAFGRSCDEALIGLFIHLLPNPPKADFPYDSESLIGSAND